MTTPPTSQRYPVAYQGGMLYVNAKGFNQECYIADMTMQEAIAFINYLNTVQAKVDTAAQCTKLYTEYLLATTPPGISETLQLRHLLIRNNIGLQPVDHPLFDNNIKNAGLLLVRLKAAWRNTLLRLAVFFKRKNYAEI